MQFLQLYVQKRMELILLVLILNFKKKYSIRMQDGLKGLMTMGINYLHRLIYRLQGQKLKTIKLLYGGQIIPKILLTLFQVLKILKVTDYTERIPELI